MARRTSNGSVADAVDARGPDPLARVIARLRDAEAILLLDACEHALAEAARVASAVLPECPGVRVLATSREVLHLAGEVRVTLKPLRAPEAAATDGADSPAVQLFAARARAARPGFELTADAVPLAAEIARRVDGLPLAIELAAARINVLGLAELSSLVERRLALLRDRPPSDPIRTALQGLVEWSYELLHTRREDAAAPARGAPRRRLALLAARRRCRTTGSTRQRSTTCSPRSSTSRSSRSPSRTKRRATTCSTRSATTRSSAWPKAAASPPLASAHAEYFATLADARAAPGYAGRSG